jgi:hypothetical protein
MRRCSATCSAGLRRAETRTWRRWPTLSSAGRSLRRRKSLGLIRDPTLLRAAQRARAQVVVNFLTDLSAGRTKPSFPAGLAHRQGQPRRQRRRRDRLVHGARSDRESARTRRAVGLALARRCFGCGRRTRNGSRCPPCTRLYNSAYNSTTKRARARARATIAASPLCENCGATTDLTADHVVPVIDGGATGPLGSCAGSATQRVAPAIPDLLIGDGGALGAPYGRFR